jgi:hypothetical protein
MSQWGCVGSASIALQWLPTLGQEEGVSELSALGPVGADGSCMQSTGASTYPRGGARRAGGSFRNE